MLLTITTTHTPATDLGYLLHKNPARLQSFNMSFGTAHMFYPETSEQRCTAALMLEVDPVGLVRTPRGEGRSLGQYVNDRPYVCSSFMSVAISQVLGSALGGRSKERPELAQSSIPLEATLRVVSCRGDGGLIHRLFEPLGYTVETDRHPLDPQIPEWGESPYYTVRLSAVTRLSDLLTHLYVLLPALDAEKHYFIDDFEVDKLLSRGEGWLTRHPEKETIVRRYLKHRGALVRQALSALTDDADDDDAPGDAEVAVEQSRHLHDLRLEAVRDVLVASAARRVLDLGCGEGRLLVLLAPEKQFTELIGMDAAHRSLEYAHDRLHLDQQPAQERIRLVQGALTYRDRRLEGFDAAAIVEVIEHLDPARLDAFTKVLFGYTRPGTIVLSTPNRDYNPKFELLPPGALRHKDHRFEWTRAEFLTWVTAAADRYGYHVNITPLGPEDPEVGAPSQMAVFTKTEP